MISQKELEYVDDLYKKEKPKKIPMPGFDYSLTVLTEMADSLDLFINVYKDKEYSFIFSNGEEVEFEVLSKNLCHMLGIDHPKIMGENYNDYRKQVFGSSATMSSYDLLNEILKNKTSVAQYDNDKSNPNKMINYYKAAVKCAILKRLSEFDKFNFCAINSQSIDEGTEYGSFKYLFVPSNEPITPYFMMGIKYTDKEKKFVVSTLMAPKNPKPFFENQEVIIPTQIIIADGDVLKKLIATPEEKIQLLTMYSNIINKYNIPNKINVYVDYEATLNDIANTRTLHR